MEKVKPELNVLKNKAECMTRVHNYLNAVLPELLQEFKKGYKLTVNNTFYKKDKDRFNAIIKKYHPYRAWITIRGSSIALETDDVFFDSYYHDGTLGSVSYYKQYVYLNDDYISNSDIKYSPVTEEELRSATKEIEELKEKRSEIDSKISELKYKYDL